MSASSTMTVDIYVPEINNEYRGVYILSNSIQTGYGTITLPEVDSVGLIVLYHRSKQPVVMGFIPPYGFNSGKEKFEVLKPGETQISSKGKGFLKCDVSGNTAIGNAEALDFFLPNGKNIVSSLGKEEISNFHTKDLHIEHNDDIITIGKTFKYHQAVKVQTFSVDDIYKSNNTLDRDTIDSVIDEANNILDSLNSLFEKTENIRNSVISHTASREDIDKYAESLEDFKLKPSGITVEGALFKDCIISLLVKDSDKVIAGIEIDEEKGMLIGEWRY